MRNSAQRLPGDEKARRVYQVELRNALAGGGKVKMKTKCEGCGKEVTEEKLDNNEGFCDDCYDWRCGLCGKLVTDKENNWTWGEEISHRKCVLNTADTICSKCGMWFSILDSINIPCEECGGKMRELSKEDKERLLKEK